jgi:polysaccharide export outer membrane protein
MRALFLTFVLALQLVLGGCAQGLTPTGGPVLAAGDMGVSAKIPDYVLGSGDKLRIVVFGEESLSREYTVNPAGQISFPLIGNVTAGGLTITQLQEEIVDRLSPEYLRNPQVSAEVLNFRPFYILGEVNKPGEYPYVAGLTVVNAVARAEGFTYRADGRRVFIKRAGETVEREYPLTTSTAVAPGDTIRIRERYF